jgi:membrane fusion protein, multidrug efflux system
VHTAIKRTLLIAAWVATPATLIVACTGRAANAPPRVPVSVARVERRPVPYEIAATGTVEPIRSVDVLPQVTGTILKVRFAEGDEVTAGQVLFEIDPRPYEAAALQAGANLLRDLAQAENAARDAERYRDLATNNTVTKEDYQQKQATSDALAATVRADSAALTVARLNLEYATIRAPIAGRTGRLQLHEGNVVRPGSTPSLVSINQLRPILVRFSVPAAQLPELRRRAGKPLQTLASADTGAPAEGVLSFLDNQVDTTTGTVLLKARFPNRDGTLWPGEFVEVTLIVDVQADALVVPAQAVMTSQQGTYVFVVNADGRADQRAVTVTRTVDSMAVLAAGLAPGTLVVIDGQLRLNPDSRVEIRSGPKTEPTQQ